MQTTATMQKKRIRFSTLFLPKSYGGLQMRIRCGAICLIALFVALSVQETNASKQLAPGALCAHLLTDLISPMGPTPPSTMIILNRETYKKFSHLDHRPDAQRGDDGARSGGVAGPFARRIRGHRL